MSQWARAPGKVILAGEHAVVYGHPAVALPVQAVAVEAQVGGDDWIWQDADPEAAPAHTLLKPLCHSLGAELRSRGLLNTLPMGARVRGGARTGGLGTSAALCVALTRAYLAVNDVRLPDAIVGDIANMGETQFHGQPSGIDAAVSAHGCPIAFTKAKGPEPIQVGGLLHFVAATSRVRSSTLEAVAGVARRRKTHADTDRWLGTMGDAADDARAAITTVNLDALGRAMEQAQQGLVALELDHPVLAGLRRVALEAGARTAKVTGAGLGGSILVLTESEDAAISVRDALLQDADCLGAWCLTLGAQQ